MAPHLLPGLPCWDLLRAAMPSMLSSSDEMASVTCSSSSRVPVNMLLPMPRSPVPTSLNLCRARQIHSQRIYACYEPSSHHGALERMESISSLSS